MKETTPAAAATVGRRRLGKLCALMLTLYQTTMLRQTSPTMPPTWPWLPDHTQDARSAHEHCVTCRQGRRPASKQLREHPKALALA